MLRGQRPGRLRFVDSPYDASDQGRRQGQEAHAKDKKKKRTMTQSELNALKTRKAGLRNQSWQPKNWQSPGAASGQQHKASAKGKGKGKSAEKSGKGKGQQKGAQKSSGKGASFQKGKGKGMTGKGCGKSNKGKDKGKGKKGKWSWA